MKLTPADAAAAAAGGPVLARPVAMCHSLAAKIVFSSVPSTDISLLLPRLPSPWTTNSISGHVESNNSLVYSAN